MERQWEGWSGKEGGGTLGGWKWEGEEEGREGGRAGGRERDGPRGEGEREEGREGEKHAFNQMFVVATVDN